MLVLGSNPFPAPLAEKAGGAVFGSRVPKGVSEHYRGKPILLFVQSALEAMNDWHKRVAVHQYIVPVEGVERGARYNNALKEITARVNGAISVYHAHRQQWEIVVTQNLKSA